MRPRVGRGRASWSCCSPARSGPSTHLALSEEFHFFRIQSSAVRPLGQRPATVHGECQGPCTISIRLENDDRGEECILKWSKPSFVSRSMLNRKEAQQPADQLSEGCFDLGKLAGRQGHS